MSCDSYEPNKIFQNFRVVEFPFSFVGISSEVELDVGVNLNTSAYMMTYHNGQIMKFEDAQAVSPAHKAFEVHQTGDHSINICYKPTKSCVSWTRVKKDIGNKFICDLRFIKVDGIPCCSDPRHAEVGRMYLCGQYEYCKLSHSPQVVDFGNLMIGQQLSRYIEIRNDSTLPAVIEKDVQPIAAHHIKPPKLTIPPKSKEHMLITIKPTCLKVQNVVKLNIKNASNMLRETEDNFIPYEIAIKVNVLYNKKPTVSCHVAESLKQIYDQDPSYTYMEDELEQYHKKQKIALGFLKEGRRPLPVIKQLERNSGCYSTMSLHKILRNGCEPELQSIAMYDLLDVSISPHTVEFGKIAFKSYDMKKITIKNNTRYEIMMKLMKDEHISYTNLTVKSMSLKMLPNSQQQINIFCLGIAGCNFRSFKYSINKKYLRAHNYKLQTEPPYLRLTENNYKLGMVNPDVFITSASVRLTNEFNVTVNFEWDDLTPDVPFDIVPKCGSVPKHSTRFCNISYVCKQTRKLHVIINFRSFGSTEENRKDCNKVTVPVEVTVLTRKLGMKFVDPQLVFKDLPLNLESSLEAKLENCSREFATFYIVEPLIPGFRVEPKSGIIRPKMLTMLTVSVKLPCIIDFNVDITFKLNCRENFNLNVSGNVLEPRIVIYPRVMHLPRIPSNLLTYVPITVQNLSPLKTLIDILEIEDESCNKMFELYVAYGNEKHRISHLYIEGNQSKTIFLKICEEYRREFEFYLPIQVNRVLGPPNIETALTDLQYYTRVHSYQYENLSPQIKLKNTRREIAYCRVIGVITIPWLKFSQDSFDIIYNATSNNMIEFTVTNISRRLLYIIISTAKLAPNFTLYVAKDEHEQSISSNHIAIELDLKEYVTCTVKFHPKGHGFFTTSAPIFVDNCMGTPYSNLTFTGTRKIAKMSANTHRVMFPPCVLGMEIQHPITLKLEGEADKTSFFCESREERYLNIKFMDETVSTIENDEVFTIIEVHIIVCCKIPYSRVMLLNFCNENGAACEVEIGFCYLQCPLTLHVNNIVDYSENTYPFYPTKDNKVYEYMERTLEFLEKWMFVQGYRRDFYPQIPESFYALSQKSSAGSKSKSSAGNFANFIKRLAGPLIKYSRRANVYGMDEAFKNVLEVYDSYEEVIRLLKARNCHLWIIQARFLLSFEQFSIYCNNVTSKTNADILLTRELLEDPESYYRLSKLAWMEFVLQCYRAFVLNCCFLDCACLKTKQRDVLKVLTEWYNKHIAEQHFHLRGQNKSIKTITNITTDMSDGIAIISVLLHYCPFMKKHFKSFAEVEASNGAEACIINNACLIDDALKYIRILFPLSYSDFLAPNFVQMLFLSIHLFIALPMFYPRDIIRFKPPLLRSSARLVTVYPATQESLICSLFILNNNKNAFAAEKAHFNDSNKKSLVKVKYTANFLDNDHAILIIQGTNKSRIYDTYVLFLLEGQTGFLHSLKRCKVSGQLYRPNKVEISVLSPFFSTATYDVSITDQEPRVPVDFGSDTKRRFYLRRLNLSQKRITLNATQKGLSEEENVYKLYLQMVCLNSRAATYFIWFRSDIGEFFIKVVSQARWDMAVDTLHATVSNWPLEPCNCGETCKCYRSTVVTVPHRNDMMIKALRIALLEHATPEMMAVFDRLINSVTGRGIVAMLLEDGGTDVSQVAHILREQTIYKLSSRSLVPQSNQVTLAIHSDALLLLPITLPTDNKFEKFSFYMTSQCGMDMRFYRVLCVVETSPTTEEDLPCDELTKVCSSEDSTNCTY